MDLLHMGKALSLKKFLLFNIVDSLKVLRQKVS